MPMPMILISDARQWIPAVGARGGLQTELTGPLQTSTGSGPTSVRAANRRSVPQTGRRSVQGSRSALRFVARTARKNFTHSCAPCS